MIAMELPRIQEVLRARYGDAATRAITITTLVRKIDEDKLRTFLRSRHWLKYARSLRRP